MGYLLVKVLVLAVLGTAIPIAITIITTIATSTEEEKAHAARGGNMSNSPMCQSCKGVTEHIRLMLKEDPMPPLVTSSSSSSSSSASDSSKGSAKDGGAGEVGAAGAGGGSSASDDDDGESIAGAVSEKEKIQAKRKHRANQILQRLCSEEFRSTKFRPPKLDYWEDYCQKVIRKQRLEVLTYIFNSSNAGSKRSKAEVDAQLCRPFCAGVSPVDFLEFFILRTMTDPVVRRIAKEVGELWGSVLLLSVVGGLLGMSLHLRVVISKQLVRRATLTPMVAHIGGASNGGAGAGSGRTSTPSDGGGGSLFGSNGLPTLKRRK
jgi:hypothetical protein